MGCTCIKQTDDLVSNVGWMLTICINTLVNGFSVYWQWNKSHRHGNEVCDGKNIDNSELHIPSKPVLRERWSRIDENADDVLTVWTLEC